MFSHARAPALQQQYAHMDTPMTSHNHDHKHNHTQFGMHAHTHMEAHRSWECTHARASLRLHAHIIMTCTHIRGVGSTDDLHRASCMRRAHTQHATARHATQHRSLASRDQRVQPLMVVRPQLTLFSLRHFGDAIGFAETSRQSCGHQRFHRVPHRFAHFSRSLRTHHVL